MISLLLVAIAAFFNVLMDWSENEHIWQTPLSKFKDKPFFNTFIYKRESWDKAKRILGFKIDLWHLSKSLMLCSLSAAIIFFQPISKNILLDFTVFGIIWNLTFNLIYNLKH